MTDISSELLARITEVMNDLYLPPIMEECLEEHDEGRYILFERGHYGMTFLSWHDTPEAAAQYTMNQEYSEDWHAEALLDTETNTVLAPQTIVWG